MNKEADRQIEDIVCHFPIGILGQAWYLIVSIPDLCNLITFIMLRKDVIQPSTSPWASGIVMVTKKDGSKRFCVDYRKLNDVTTKDAYPLPRIDDSLDQLSGAEWFSCLDLNSGYWQVEVEESDRPKNSICFEAGPL